MSSLIKRFEYPSTKALLINKSEVLSFRFLLLTLERPMWNVQNLIVLNSIVWLQRLYLTRVMSLVCVLLMDTHVLQMSDVSLILICYKY